MKRTRVLKVPKTIMVNIETAKMLYEEDNISKALEEAYLEKKRRDNNGSTEEDKKTG